MGDLRGSAVPFAASIGRRALAVIGKHLREPGTCDVEVPGADTVGLAVAERRGRSPGCFSGERLLPHRHEAALRWTDQLVALALEAVHRHRHRTIVLDADPEHALDLSLACREFR